ncbi:MAG: hypothetical protein RLZZ519_1104 [Bacteroidota bacterium]
MVLNSGNPSGGTYVGWGATNGVFDPGTAGAGSHLMTYSYVDSNGCQGNATTNAVVNLNPNAPVLTFSQPSLSTTANADSVQWFFNGTYLLTNGTSINPSQNGLYSAIVWLNGCPSDTSAATLVELVGMQEGSNSTTFKAWPNPVNGNSVHIGANVKLRFEVSVLDALGRKVLAEAEMDQLGELNLSHLANGIYFLRIRFEGDEEYLQLIKE